MLDEKLVEQIVEEVLAGLRPKAVGPPKQTDRPKCKAAEDRAALPPLSAPPVHPALEEKREAGALDLASPQAKAEILLRSPQDPDALLRMKARTTARIGVGRCGPRLNTRTLLTLRADHAAARDAVFTDVDQAMLDRLGLFTIQTRCRDKNEFLTRPDLGRQFDEETLAGLREKCVRTPDIQIYAADGLSSTAVNENLPNILPVLLEGLPAKGFKVGTPFFVRYGRVPAMDQVSETLGAAVTCVLLGERPGLATAESMSAYIAYKATVGMPEARRTVVSNIHRAGISAVEAGAYICDVIEAILAAKASGVDLRK
ncbi:MULTISPECIES: ethanolamine ammonia-lyase subunit EutC [Anaerotruncus]|uniref:ethanolamine ammonia-lyase subunit EutC n=1 Tax=Anaerotruncus TaxID=244127 RepID=UPI0008352B85|nr:MULTISPECIES: ethanolamine ammonia-lyase subunit EutC [Anaerotruncus]RGX55233.1 ethanolamine ammonia-lyase subunit EutC [Anaerotruncus sp. AF02-27]